MDQPQLLLRAVCARRRILPGLRAVRIPAAGGCPRNRTARAVPGSAAAGHRRRQLAPAGQRRQRTRPGNAERCTAATIGCRLRSRKHRPARSQNQGAVPLRDPGHHARPGADCARVRARRQTGRDYRLGARGRRGAVRPAQARLRLRHDPEPPGPVAVARQRAEFLLEQCRGRHQRHPQLHGRQGARDRCDDRGDAGSPWPAGVRLRRPRPRPGADVRLLRHPGL